MISDSSICINSVVRPLSFYTVGSGDQRKGSRYPGLTAVKREKFAKNKKNTSKERLSLLPFKV